MERLSEARRTSPIPITSQALDPAGSSASAVHNPSIQSLSSSSPWSVVNPSSSELASPSNVRSYNGSDSAFASSPWSLNGPYTSSERSPSHGAVRTPLSAQRSPSNPAATPPGSTNINAVPDYQNALYRSAADTEVDDIFSLDHVQADSAWYDLFDPDVLAQVPSAFLQDPSRPETGVSNMRSRSDPNLLSSSKPLLHSSTHTSPSWDDGHARGRTEHYSEPQFNRRATLPPGAPLDIDEDLNNKDFNWQQSNTPFDCLYPDYDLRFEGSVISTEPPEKSTQASKVVTSSKTNGSKAKRQKLDPDQKQKVKRARGLGACLRCRIYREPCDENTPCGTCTRKGASAVIFRQPCFREKLDSVVAFRLGMLLNSSDTFVTITYSWLFYRVGNSTQGQTRGVYPKVNWSAQDTTIRTIDLIYPHTKNKVSPILTLECRVFIPGSKDVTDLHWKSNGVEKELKIPPYAIFDVNVGYQAMERFLDQCQAALHESVICETSDEIMLLTLAEAARFSKTHSHTTIENALKIRDFAIKRVALRPEDPLDIPIVNDEQSRHHNTRPIPRFVNIQIEQMVNTIIDSHRKVVIKRLKSLIFGSGAIKHWFEIYLSIFLLLDTLEWAYQWQLKYVGWAAGTSLHHYIDYVTDYMLDEWQYSAEVLISHFRCVIRGQTPFSQDSEARKDSFKQLGLDAPSVEYLEKVITLLASKEKDFKDLKDSGSFKLDRRFVWLSQLFLGDQASKPRSESDSEMEKSPIQLGDTLAD
ncbi:hypothetical protein MMC11_007725 [Xylographa trunciseda]|nr:hypothetical protein [Xylographa trunciseda]